jgi:uncharacterized protein (DUF433 family)
VPGVTVPGGWLDLPLAAALAAAAAVVWIRRRRAYTYEPFEDDDVEEGLDDDLQALPAVMARLRRAVREHAESLPQPWPAPTSPHHGQAHGRGPEYGRGPGYGGPAGLPVSPTPGGAGSGPVPAVAIPAGGLGLSGGGATAAARALLVASLTRPNPAPARAGERSDGGDGGDGAAGALVVTRTVLNTLLPGWQAPETAFGGRLVIVGDLDEALTFLATPVTAVLGQFAAGCSVDQLLDDYPHLDREDVLAALEYAAMVDQERELPLARPA